MNWTSEFEPPPPRPTVESATADDPGDVETTAVETGDAETGDVETTAVETGDAEPGDVQPGDADRSGIDPLDIEGPLDPAVFDGLFDDLTLVDDNHVSDRRLEPVDYVELFDDLDNPQQSSTAVDEIASEPVEEFDDGEPEATTSPDAPDWQITVADLAQRGEDREDQDPARRETDDDERGGALLPEDRLFLDAPINLPDATETAENSASVFSPVPAEDEAGPVDPQVEPAILDDSQLAHAAPLAELPGGESPLQRSRRRNQLPAFAVATVVGAALGIGVALIAYQVASSEPQLGDASTPLIAEQTEPGADPDPDPASPTITESPQPASVAENANLTSISFVTGTSELTETAESRLAETVASLSESSTLAATITVRTFTEASAEANHALSQAQAQAVKDFLDSSGLSFSSAAVRGLGAAPLSPAIPVQNFVVLSHGLRSGPVKAPATSFSPFSVGVDPETLELRPDSLPHLIVVGEALAAAEDSTITLAGYSYDRPDQPANKVVATAATEAARNYLVTNYNIDPSRILTVNPGQLPYVVGSEAGAHVDVRIGPSATVAAAIGSLDSEAMNFSPGSARLSDSSEAEFDRLAQVMIESGASVVITVHTATQSSTTANAELSTAQADVILSYLVAAGVSAERLRVIGAGDVQGISRDGLPSSVIITTVG